MEFYEIDKPNSCLGVQDMKLGIESFDCSSFHLLCMTTTRQGPGTSRQRRESSSATPLLAGEEYAALDREREAPQDGKEGMWPGDGGQTGGRNVGEATRVHPPPLMSRAELGRTALTSPGKGHHRSRREGVASRLLVALPE
jgi:hypothetical protein